jgi:hypothetical protein
LKVFWDMSTEVRFFERLSIGRKIAVGFGLTGLLFVIVAWQYHGTLFRALGDYDHLQSMHGAKKTHALNIHRYMLEARRSEKDFLSRRETAYVERVAEFVRLVLAEATELKAIEEKIGGRRVAVEIVELMETYHAAFRDIVVAWKIEGLDHESGVQGRFRETIHEVEAMARKFHAADIYLTLLQIRRAEKNLGLRRVEPYTERVRDLIRRLGDQVRASGMDDAVKPALAKAIEDYARAFEKYASEVLAGMALNGGKGAFRDAAHVLENLLRERYVPDLERDILSLRRHEKDYLLRGGNHYVERVGRQIRGILDNITASPIAAADKTTLVGLIHRYEKDFLSLVEQNDRIIALTARMRDAVHRIEPLVAASADEAVAEMAAEAATTRESSRRTALLALSIAVAAILLGATFAVYITRRITGPVTTLVGLAEMISGGRTPIDEAAPKDEIAALAVAMGHLTGSHQDMLARLSRKAETLSAVADDLATISHSLEEGKSAAEMRELGHTVNASAADLVKTVDGLRKMLSHFRTG